MSLCRLPLGASWPTGLVTASSHPCHHQTCHRAGFMSVLHPSRHLDLLSTYYVQVIVLGSTATVAGKPAWRPCPTGRPATLSNVTCGLPRATSVLPH